MNIITATLGSLLLTAPMAMAQSTVRTLNGPVNMVPLDIATVTTGATAVTALNAGHRTAGGWLFNPSGATVDLCINEMAVASGTTSAGSLICIAKGTRWDLTPSPAPVSVITSDSSHPFAGMGWQP